MKKPSILLIDDEQAILETLQAVLCDEGYTVTTLQDPATALTCIGELIPDLVLLDIFMPNSNGISLLEKIKKEYPTQKVIMISGFGNISIALEAIKKGALDFIEKPLNLDEILAKLLFLKEQDFSCQDTSLAATPTHLVGESYLFKEMLRNVERIAPLPFPVLIYGHHGTGKTTIARYIHSLSNKKELPFASFNCGIQNDEALKNFINLHQEGTLLFKNINYLPLPQQQEILTLFDHDNVRIIASSSQQLYTLYQQHLFLGPLFYKLNVVPLEIPPLSKRRHDIPLLINHFLEEENTRLNKNLILSTASVRLLRNTNWQNNIHQLKNFIKHLAATIENNNVINPEALYPYLEEKEVPFVEEQSFTTFNSLEEAKTTFEKHFLLYHLKKSRYNLDQVSDKLNLKMQQLRARMQELNIELTN